VRSSEITADVRAFFTTYCTAFIRYDAPAIARHLADQIHVASETGQSVRVQIETADDWRKTIDHLLDMYRAINFASAEVREMSVHPVSARLVQASLHWALRDGNQAPLYEFDALYTLARHSETFKIIAIAHNEIPQYRSCLERVGSQAATHTNTGGKRP
jgi:ketosteroid isomerase-like protein